MFASSSRMTADGLPPSIKDNAVKEVEKGEDLIEGVTGNDSQILHDTRSQKQASKKRLHEDHAETLTKDSSFTVASDTTNNSVGVATRSSTRPTKRPKLTACAANGVINQGTLHVIIIYVLHKRHKLQTRPPF